MRTSREAPSSVRIYRASELTDDGRELLRHDPYSISWMLVNGYRIAPMDVGIELRWDDHAQELTISRSDPVDELWRAIQLREKSAFRLPRRGRLPATGPGILYVKKASTAQIAAVVASSLAGAVAALGWDAADTRPCALFAEGKRKKLRKRSVVFVDAPNPLPPGRPLHVRSASDLRARAPHAAGIYRIHRATNDGVGEVYVGQAVDLRRRLSNHEKVRDWGWGGWSGITGIDLLPIRDGAVIVIDLDEAEEQLITRAREREQVGGPRVANRTHGGNGRKADLAHVYILAVDRRCAYEEIFSVNSRMIDSEGVQHASVELAEFTLIRDVSPNRAAFEWWRAGDRVEAIITGLSDHFAYANIDGIPASIHIGQLATGYVTHPSEIVSIGSHVTARILTVDPSTQEVTLTLTGNRREAAPPAPRRP